MPFKSIVNKIRNIFNMSVDVSDARLLFLSGANVDDVDLRCGHQPRRRRVFLLTGIPSRLGKRLLHDRQRASCHQDGQRVRNAEAG
jgi:hypothetical protein